MSKRDVILKGEEVLKRLSEGHSYSHEYSYKNPFLLATLYYTEGLSTIEMAEVLGCEQRTIRRYMNYYGYRRFTKKFALLVKHHGLQGAYKIMKPEYYPLGIHND
ncbi:hypothetical protein CN367_11595 [Priestia megaterium]|uniref:hypothetical protein n=1 Tax=Priestia megaterium TaxID=1404 RepID=UPI000BF6B4FA|nr:hypothetical protein [Priestia megaterium]PEZ47007.1 hypothetical protein CN367_11595 [Priestia megaterium]